MSHGLLARLAKSGGDLLAASKYAPAGISWKGVQNYSVIKGKDGQATPAAQGSAGSGSTPATEPESRIGPKPFPAAGSTPAPLIPSASKVPPPPASSPLPPPPASAPLRPPPTAKPPPSPLSMPQPPPPPPPRATIPAMPVAPGPLPGMPTASVPPPPPPGTVPPLPQYKAVEGPYAWLGWLIPLIAAPAGYWYYQQVKEQDKVVFDAIERDRQEVLAAKRGDSAPAPSLFKAIESAVSAPPKPVPPPAAPKPVPPPAAAAPVEDVPTPAPVAEPSPPPQDLSAQDVIAAAAAVVADAAPEVSPAPTPVMESSSTAATAPETAAPHPVVPQMTLEQAVAASESDMTPEGLLLLAALAKATVVETPEDRARHVQAEADARAFKKVLTRMEQEHQEQLQQARTEASQAAARADAAERANSEAVTRFQSLLRQHQGAATELRELEVRQAEKRATVRANKAMGVERVERAKVLDAVREKVNALSEALDAASTALSSGSTSRRITQGILALEADLAAGRPLAGHLSALQRVCGDDPVVSVALASVPRDMALKGVPTGSELQAQFHSIRPTIGELSYFADGRAGMLAHLMAKTANWLKADEGQYVAAGMVAPEGSGIDTALAHTEVLLTQGQLTQAAETLSAAVKGTIAEQATQQWQAAVRARVLTDQAVALLRAHAITLAATLE